MSLSSKLLKTAVLISSGLFLGACSASDSKSGGGNSPQSVTACSLEGTWSRCSTYGGSSSRVQLIAAGQNLSESIENFDNTTDCSGAPDSTMNFTAQVALEEDGASTFIAGGTDAILTPVQDIFGCGAGQPTYTTLKFSSDCRQFQPSGGQPVCSASARGTTLDPEFFVKQ